MRKVWIYTLAHPITLEIKYIGKTFRPNRRLIDHLRCDGNTKKDNWIKHLIKNDLTPFFEILEETDSENCDFLEQYWICQFRSWGFELKNMTNGGDGSFGLTPWNKGLKGVFKHSEESKQKMSTSRKGKYTGVNHFRFGKKLPAEVIEKMRLSKIGKKRTDDFRIKVRGVNNKRSKEIYCYTIDLQFIKKYNSLRETTIDGFDYSKVSKICRGKCKFHKGHTFSYIAL